MRLVDLVATSEAVAATASRTEKEALLAQALTRLEPEEISAGVALLSGTLRQRQTGVGWASLREPPPPAGAPSLSVAEVEQGVRGARAPWMVTPSSCSTRR